MANRREPVAISPDYTLHIHCCPWHTQFKEMGLIEAGHDYCEHLVESFADFANFARAKKIRLHYRGFF